MDKFKYEKSKIGLYNSNVIDVNGRIISDSYLSNLEELLGSEKRTRFYRRKSWRNLRLLIMVYYDWKCQLQAEGCTNKAHHIHHIRLLRNNPELAFSVYYKNERQLVPLCEKCHSKVHQGSKGEIVDEELNNSLK